MNSLQRWLASGIWLAAIAAAALTARDDLAHDDLWFHVILTAALVFVALAFVWRWGAVGRLWWALTALLALAAGALIYVAWTDALNACTAHRADGRRVVIGTQFTERGRLYRLQSPNEDNDAIVESLADLGPDYAWTQASIDGCRLRLLWTGVGWVPLFGIALICATGLLNPGSINEKKAGRKRVFISYSHEDQATAGRVLEHLRSQGFDVIVDAESMSAGDKITEFIARSVREADAVVSIVSTTSLMSGWVALETILSFEREKFEQNKIYVPCTLTDDFRDSNFRLRCTGQIDLRLRELEELIPEYAEQKLDTSDLDQEKTRLYDLRNNLGKVVARLKDSLCLDFREGTLPENLKRLTKALETRRPP